MNDKLTMKLKPRAPVRYILVNSDDVFVYYTVDFDLATKLAAECSCRVVREEVTYGQVYQPRARR